MPKRFLRSAASTFLDSEGVIADLTALARRALERRPALRRVILFGSLAEGRAVPGSDADLVLIDSGESGREVRLRDRVAAIQPLFEDAPVGVDLFVTTEDEWGRRLARKDRFALHVERTGRELARR